MVAAVRYCYRVEGRILGYGDGCALVGRREYGGDSGRLENVTVTMSN